MERTWRFQQQDIVKQADVGVSHKVFDLELPELGPYSVDFTRNGRHLVLAGHKGHLAVLEWQSQQLVCEVQVCAVPLHTTRLGCNARSPGMQCSARPAPHGASTGRRRGVHGTRPTGCTA
jgi:hypothetical protein